MKRQATIKRISKETEIELTLKLDGTRNYTIDTGVGFLDHMLKSTTQIKLVLERLSSIGK